MLDRFAGRELVITTSFGMEGCALIDMVAAHGRPVRVVYLDTMFLFPETYASATGWRSGTRISCSRTAAPPSRPTRRSGSSGPSSGDGIPMPAAGLRKVEPMRAALAGVDVWMTGLTRSQSAIRSASRSSLGTGNTSW